jgi:RNA polymerase sigma factor (sigma-70 family)
MRRMPLNPLIPAAPSAATAPGERFARLAEPHVPQMHAAARRLVGSDDLAWDAVQDTLVQLWQNDRLGGDSRGVLIALVRPRSLALLRARKRRAARELCYCLLCDEPQDDPTAGLEARERLAALAAAIDDLPIELRELVVARVREDLDYAALASRFALPIGTVRSRLHRARQRLHDRLTSRADSAARECA